MDEPTYTTTVDALEAELRRCVELAERTEADLAVPSCPGWDAAALWKHLGMVHRWAAELVRTGSPGPIDRRTMDMHLPSEDLWAPWLAEGADDLLATLRSAAALQPVWTWGDGPDGGTAAWWARRQLHETLLHDADAALALGDTFDVDPEVAADALDELFDNLPSRLARRDPTEPVEQVTTHLHATDDELAHPGEWLVSIEGGGLTYTHEHGKGDAALRAPVAALLLATYGRAPAESGDAELFGPPEAWQRFTGAVSLD